MGVEILIDECSFEDPQFQYILHGMDLLPRAFARELKNGQIQFNSKVTEINRSSHPSWWKRKNVSVKIDCKGINCGDVVDNKIQADAVIVAIPAGPTLSINFKPKLSVQKTHALRTTPYSSSTKVILAFETPFWDEDNNNKVGGATNTDLPVKRIYYEMNRSKGGLIVVLASYTRGRDAQRHTGMSDNDVVE